MPFKRKPRDREDLPWWHKGLRFECTGCAQCCGGAPGVVWVSPTEAKRIAKRLGVDLREFCDVYTHRVGQRVSLTERPNGDCIMLQQKRCTVYEERPIQCRTYPWWPWNLETPADWDALAAECPGCNRGKKHSSEAIERERRKRL